MEKNKSRYLSQTLHRGSMAYSEVFNALIDLLTLTRQFRGGAEDSQGGEPVAACWMYLFVTSEGERPSKESAKRQKIEDDAEKAELKACLEIVPGDDSAVNIESLATKYPIVDWKTHILAEEKDVGLKERFESTSPEGYDRLLWGDLITLFKPSEEDES
ncbi:hypothetical protein Tco_1285590 [Tanacetum coccineum]